ncbi:transport protein particle complex subunit [Gymnopilus junonius]|uniref:Transport protein particle complex subunit n=1 Tax=Gymnopilus junonius TaxID=109634 RepID=A0A9P5TTB1_GYMJU|nr:transport protein particle complex subunit [Gymnopilus junonius]
MDTHPFASLAHVRILLIPVGLIPQSLFETYANEIRNFESLRLAEIPADTRDGRAARFLPNALSRGNLHLSFPSHPPPFSHSQLSLIRPSHFPLAVIGVASCSQTDSLKSLHSQFNAALIDIFPSSSTYPLVKNCFAFEEGEGNINLDLNDNFPGLVVVPQITNRKLHIGTLLGVLCSQILSEFEVLVKALETPLGNEYLNASLMPLLPPLSELPSSLSAISKTDSPTHLPSFNSQPDMSRPSFNLSAAPTLRRNASSTTTTPTNRQSTLGIQTQKKRLSTIGTSSSHGRLYKMLGDFFLLAGRTEDAAVWYNEAIQLFRGSHDPLWYACTLEGLATLTIIEAWSAGHGLNNSASAVKEPWTDVSDRLQQAINLYQKTPAPETELMHSLHAFLYCGCVLRQTSLFFSVWSAKGWGPLAFTTMLQPGPEPNLPPTLTFENGDEFLTLERLSSVTGITRASIAAVLAQLHGPWLLHLGQRERINILEITASFYACLGYQRKEAYILREVLGCLLDLMVCGREEDGYSQPSTVPQSAGLGIHNVHPVPGSNWGSVGVRITESSEGNESVLRLLKHVCRVLGINLEAVALVEGSKRPNSEQMPSLSDYDEDIVQELHEPVGWPELQVGVVREAVAVAEALPDFPVVAQFALSSLKTLQSVLTPADQYHLYATASRALVTARRRGDSRAVEYWSGRPIVSISLAPLPAIRVPVGKPRSIQNRIGDLRPLVQGIVDPFLYNPRKAAAGKGKSLVVQNEVLEFVITLQNPYIFDLELQEISLSTSGVPFESEPLHTIVPANTLHQIVLSGKANATGILTVRGCFVQAPGGTLREYFLPLYTAEEEERLARKKRAIHSENGRSKYSGLHCYPWSKVHQHANRKSTEGPNESQFRFLECKVVPEQPLLRIRRSSVTHGALMLYDGEQSTIRLTLENVSPIAVDFLHLAFEDSTIEPAQKALADGNLSVFETYETEYNLIHNPVFSWDLKEAKSIAPNQNVTLTLGCFGKVGCTSGIIHISYSNSKAPDLQDSDVFYIRQVSYPLMVTVYHMLECSNLDLLQFPSYPTPLRRSNNSENARLSSLQSEDDAGWCLFSIEVRNTYGSPFDVTLVRTQDGETAASLTTTIPPGSASRLVIPIKKIFLTGEVLSKPIPTLSDRQFVVTQSDLSQSELKTQRELFWYREELFNCVKGLWRETGGMRTGELSFRAERMTLPMLEVFRLEIAHVSLSLESSTSPDKGSTQRTGSRYYPQVNEFIQLRTTITNLTCKTICS